MNLLKKEYYYETENGFQFRRVETGKDQYTWWKFDGGNRVWEKVQSKRLLSTLESKHKENIFERQ